MLRLEVASRSTALATVRFVVLHEIIETLNNLLHDYVLRLKITFLSLFTICGFRCYPRQAFESYSSKSKFKMIFDCESCPFSFFGILSIVNFLRMRMKPEMTSDFDPNELVLSLVIVNNCSSLVTVPVKNCERYLVRTHIHETGICYKYHCGKN